MCPQEEASEVALRLHREKAEMKKALDEALKGNKRLGCRAHDAWCAW